MCGIGGQFFHEPIIPDPEILSRMGEQMYFRGPDDEGIFIAPHIGLVHRRLSIRDLSPAGRNPMPSDDGQTQVMLNGEIYNWRELRAELEQQGYSFSTRSDVEVIVLGYQAWGEFLFPRLRGMFAIALWDGTRQKLHLVRDRVGEKPLFLKSTNSTIEFSSSIQALTSHDQEREIAKDGLGCYLVHSFIPHSVTIWQGVKVLPPAHMLSITPGQPALLKRYWEFPKCAPQKGKKAKQLITSIEPLLQDSVERCLDADVPVGVFLSGGVDSSLIAGLASRIQPDIPAFSLGFAEQDFSELPYASIVAKHLGIPHHTITISAEDVVDALPHLVSQYGQPFGDSSSIPSFFISQLARKYVKVSLSGDGGDEAFGGYWRMQSGVYAARFASLVPHIIRANIIPHISRLAGRLGNRIQALNTLSLAPPGGGYTNNESWLEQLHEIAGPELEAMSPRALISCRIGQALARQEASTVQKILYDDFQVQLPDDYLTKVDVASMAASLEVRAPFLDREVLEAAWSLPDSMKLNFGRRKFLLKQIACKYVPHEIVNRTKMGFALPMEKWMRGLLGDYLETLLDESYAADLGWIQQETAQKYLFKHRHGENHQTRLWLLLWLELWFRIIYGEHSPNRGDSASPNSLNSQTVI